MRPLPTGTVACGRSKSYGKFCLGRHLLPGTLAIPDSKTRYFIGLLPWHGACSPNRRERIGRVKRRVSEFDHVVSFGRRIERHGRQTQCWIKLPEGWRIVSAHVSLMPGEASYLEAASVQIGLPIDAASRAAVNDDLARLSSIAQFLMDFPLGQDIEAAPVFEP